MPARMLGYTFHQLFDPDVLAIPLLAPFIPSFQILVDDISHISDADLHQRTLNAFTRLALWALRDVRTSDDIHRAFLARQDVVRQLVRAPRGIDALKILLDYVAAAGQNETESLALLEAAANLAPGHPRPLVPRRRHVSPPGHRSPRPRHPPRTRPRCPGHPMRAQLRCLEAVHPDKSLARDLSYAWARLSAATHHHAYKLAPTAKELESWLAVIDHASVSPR